MSEQPIFGLKYIPEDIKLELNNGTLTLKSGSIVTFADGSQYQTTSDKTATSGGTLGTYIICASSTHIDWYKIENVFSGASAPSGFSLSGLWYDTTNNVLKRSTDGGATWTQTNVSLPIAIISANYGFSGIIQVFNGFGYIGSSIFILPGVEGFYPNGKDGFKYLFKTTKINNLLVRNLTARYNNPIAFRSNAISIQAKLPTIVDKLPVIEDMVLNQLYYSKFDNKVFYTTNGTTISTFLDVFFGYVTTSSSSPYNITSLNIVNPFLITDLYEYQYASSKPLSQYANSVKYMALFDNLSNLFNNAKTIGDWYNVVYNLKTASGYGLDIWGVILNQGRQFSYEENGSIVNIFLGGEQTIDGITYSADYMEDMYRMVLFLKALVYITNCTLASLNNLLQFYFADKGRVYVINYGTMEIRYVFEFYVSKLEKAIFTTDVLPKPTGVLANFEYIPLGEYFGFYVDGIADPEEQPFAPFDNKPFYS